MSFVDALALPLGGSLFAGESAAPLQPPRIIESDIPPQSQPRPSSPLDSYVATLQAMLRRETAAIPETGLVDIRLTIRRDGGIDFAEVVPLDGPATLREQVLAIVTGLGPLPPPPIEVEKLLVTVVLSLRYPGNDLLDTFEEAR
jgi:outer membrane biosynthesis protein TonB